MSKLRTLQAENMSGRRWIDNQAFIAGFDGEIVAVEVYPANLPRRLHYVAVLTDDDDLIVFTRKQYRKLMKKMAH